MTLETAYQRAAAEIAGAEALLIGAGAGMGVDSGLPDFRGNEGFWKAYPPFRGKMFAEVSNPMWLRSDVDQAWGFFGHRLNLYRNTQPHAGFAILRKWTERMPGGAFVFTSNVDGHFQVAGFDESQVLECHGSIRWLQCSIPSSTQCMHDIWPTPAEPIKVDEETIRATPPHPTCPHCDRVARPNILMFGDYDWIDKRTQTQGDSLEEWTDRTSGMPRAVIEIGAGKAIPTVRQFCERHAQRLIRINPREPDGRRCISIPTGGLEALRAMPFWVVDERVGEFIPSTQRPVLTYRCSPKEGSWLIVRVSCDPSFGLPASSVTGDGCDELSGITGVCFCQHVERVDEATRRPPVGSHPIDLCEFCNQRRPCIGAKGESSLEEEQD